MADEFRMFLFGRSMLDDCVDLFISAFTKAPWNDVYDSREPVVLSIGAQKPWLKGMEYYIDRFCVREDVQGKGIGSRFLNLIETDIKNKGMNAIILNTDRGFPAEKFYRKNGFQLLEESIVLAK